MARLEPFFPTSHGRPQVDDRRVLSGIIFINRDGLRWRNAPKEYGPPKTLYNRRKRWSEMGGARIFEGLAADAVAPSSIMIDVSRRTPWVQVSLRKYLKSHRPTLSLRSNKGDAGA